MAKFKPPHRILSLVLCIVLTLTSLSGTVLADDEADLPPDGSDNVTNESDIQIMSGSSPIIMSFDELPDETLWQGYDFDTVTPEELNLPATLTGTDEDGEAIAVDGVIWQSNPDFDPAVSDMYEFSPLLPEGYILSDGVTLPLISVFIRPEGEAAVIAELVAEPMAAQITSVLNFVGFGAGSGDGWIWNGGDTLTLDGLDLLTADPIPLKVPAGTTIVVNSDSRIESTSTGYDSYGIHCSGKLTIEVADGATLTVTTSYTEADWRHRSGIYVESGGFEMKGGGTLITTAGRSLHYGSSGIYVKGGDFTMSGGIITASGSTSSGSNFVGNTFASDSSGIYVNNGDFTMSDGIITATGDASDYDSSGLRVENGNFTMSGGTINATSGNGANSYGIFVRKSFTMGDGEITATATNGRNNCSGIFIDDGDFAMEDGTITATATASSMNSRGICANNKSFNMKGGSITATASGSSYNNYGIYVSQTFAMDGGSIDATGGSGSDSRGIKVENNSFTMSGGTVYTRGADSAMYAGGSVPDNTSIVGKVDGEYTLPARFDGGDIKAISNGDVIKDAMIFIPISLYYYDGEMYSDSGHTEKIADLDGWSGNGATLTLNGFNFSTGAPTALNVPAGTTIIVAGDSNIVSAYNGGYNSGYSSNGIYCSGNLTIEVTAGKTLTATGSINTNSYGISVYYGDFTMRGDGTITAIAGDSGYNSYGINVYRGNFIMSGNGAITATSGISGYIGYGYSYGIYVSYSDTTNGNFTMNGNGTITATAVDSPYTSYGICVAKNFTMNDNGTITAVAGNSDYSSGIYVSFGKFTMTGNGTITATAGNSQRISYGIYLDGQLDITGNGTITATAGNSVNYSSGIYVSYGSLNMTGDGTITAAAGSGGDYSFGIYAYRSSFNMAGGGTIYAKGANSAMYVEGDTPTDIAILGIDGSDNYTFPARFDSVEIKAISGGAAVKDAKIYIPVSLYYSNGQLYKDSGFTNVATGLTGWSGSGSTLTLNGFNFSTAAPVALTVPAGTTIIVEGNSSIESTNTSVDTTTSPSGIYCAGGLTIEVKSGKTLTATAASSISGGSYGICVSGAFTMKGDGVIYTKGADNAMYVGGATPTNIAILGKDGSSNYSLTARFNPNAIMTTSGGAVVKDTKIYIPVSLYYNNGQLYKDSGFTNVVTGLTGWSGSGTTLTLDGFNFSTAAPIALTVPAGTTIIVEGNSSIESTNASVDTISSPRGIYCAGGLTIEVKSGKTLTAIAASSVSGGSYGIYITGSFTMNGYGTIYTKGADNTMYVGGTAPTNIDIKGNSGSDNYNLPAGFNGAIIKTIPGGVVVKDAMICVPVSLYYYNEKMYLDSSHTIEVVDLDGWSGESTTLTLDGFNFSTAASTALTVPDGTTVIVSGSSNIASTYIGGNNSYGIYCDGTLSIEVEIGKTLIVTAGSISGGSYGIYVSDDFTMDGYGAIYTKGADNAMYVGGDIPGAGNIVLKCGVNYVSPAGFYGKVIKTMAGDSVIDAMITYADTLYYNSADSKMYKNSGFTVEITGLSGWSGEGSTLTLSGLRFSTAAAIALIVQDGTTIKVTEDSYLESIRSVNDCAESFGIYCDGDLTIEVEAGKYFLAISGKASEISHGIKTLGSFSKAGTGIVGAISNVGSVIPTLSCYGIYVSEDFSMSDGTVYPSGITNAMYVGGTVPGAEDVAILGMNSGGSFTITSNFIYDNTNSFNVIKAEDGTDVTDAKIITLYTVALDANGGSVSPTSMLTDADSKLASLPVPARSGYSFSGWFTAPSDGTQITATTVFTQNTTIYAHWTKTGSGGDSGGSGGGSSDGGSSRDNDDNDRNTPDTTPNQISTPTPSISGVAVDGKEADAGEVKTSGNTTTVTVNQDALGKLLETATTNVTIMIPGDTSTAVAQLVVQNVNDMAAKNMTLTVQVDNTQYEIPATAIDTASILTALGADNAADVSINITITTDMSASAQAAVNNAVTSSGGELVIPPMAFTITVTYNGKTMEIDTFSQYVTRSVEITAEQASSITTAIVVDPDGTTRHVPTRVYQSGGKWYAEVNSLTNSTYAFVHSEKTFTDTKGKWYENTVNEMASRMIISGVGNNLFAGECDITRAEFAAIIISSLGLPATGNGAVFTDVSKSAWYYGVAGTAYDYGLVTGIGNNQFAPSRKITRQEAMLMIQRAAKIAGFNGSMGNLNAFTDRGSVSDWAIDAALWNVGSGLVAGSDGKIRPLDNITRAETATLVLKMLQKTGLVDVRAPLTTAQAKTMAVAIIKLRKEPEPAILPDYNDDENA